MHHHLFATTNMWPLPLRLPSLHGDSSNPLTATTTTMEPSLPSNVEHIWYLN